MSTNFYAKRIPNGADIQLLYEYVGKRQLFGENSVASVLRRLDDKIHLCKRAGGWKILFDHNWGRYYDLTRESITQFLQNPDYQIVDEYDEPITIDEFWSMVDEWNATNQYDYTSYCKAKSDAWSYDRLYIKEEAERVEEIFGIKTDIGDFYSDGLRFSTTTDFF